jgi:Na+/melibiose symporter-like transporter
MSDEMAAIPSTQASAAGATAETDGEPRADGLAGSSKLSVWIKSVYGAGYFGQTTLQNASFLFLLIFYTDVVGMPPRLVGLALSVGRIVDAFTDPLMGQVSDRTRTRFGRRRPYIMFGSFVWGLVFLLIWLPSPLWSLGGKFAYLVMTDMLFALCLTLVQTTYFALGAELSLDYNERNSIAGYRLAFMQIGTISAAGFLMLSRFFKAQLASVADGAQQTFHILHYLAARAKSLPNPEWTTAAIVFAVVAVTFMFLSGLVPKERFASRRMERFGIREALKWTLSNANYRRVVGTHTLVFGVSALSSFLIPFITIYLIKRPGFIMPIYAVYALSGIVSLPFWLALGRRLEKSVVLRILCVFHALLCPVAFFSLDPSRPALILLLPVLAGSCQTAFLTYTHSMIGDVTDEDESKTGRRREGIYFGIYTLLLKLVFSMATLWSGFCLAYIGYVPNAEQSAQTLSWMRLLFAIPFLSTLCGLFFVRRYSLSRARLAEIHAAVQSS